MEPYNWWWCHLSRKSDVALQRDLVNVETAWPPAWLHPDTHCHAFSACSAWLWAEGCWMLTACYGSELRHRSRIQRDRIHLMISLAPHGAVACSKMIKNRSMDSITSDRPVWWMPSSAGSTAQCEQLSAEVLMCHENSENSWGKLKHYHSFCALRQHPKLDLLALTKWQRAHRWYLVCNKVAVLRLGLTPSVHSSLALSPLLSCPSNIKRLIGTLKCELVHERTFPFLFMNNIYCHELNVWGFSSYVLMMLWRWCTIFWTELSK